jgi:excisionase family DNA binding protein
VPKAPLTPLAVGPNGAARLIGVSRSRVYELINAGELPAYKDGARTLILVADIEAWLARLKPIPPSTGPLLPIAGRPLLPLKEQQIAIERATDQQQPAALAALYAERLKLIAPNVGPDEARLRSIEHTVSVFRNNNPRASLEDAKAAVMAAIAAKGRQP